MAIPNVIELCAGYGGIGLGLALALGEIKPVCYVEREITVARKLVARFQDGSLAPANIWSDVKTFDGRPYKGTIDILCAGYPCQPFSCAGKQLAEKDPRHLWPHVARIIREIEPGQVFLENVDAHARLGFYEVAGELRRMGYRCAAGLFSAEEVGAPHRRLRLFALAERTAGRRGIVRESSGSDGLADRRGEDLEDTARIPEHGQVGQDGGRWRGIRQASNAVADSGDGFISLTGRESQRRAGTGSASAPLFPPGPSDLEAWSRLLMHCPDVEPAVCGASHGRSGRVDRLRALGNGVVPLVAAHAYRTLGSDLQADVES